jgi:hypothetical protein
MSRQARGRWRGKERRRPSASPRGAEGFFRGFSHNPSLRDIRIRRRVAAALFALASPERVGGVGRAGGRGSKKGTMF